MTSLAHRIAWNTIVQVGGKGVATTLGLVITILLTRYLGPSGFGTYTFILVFVTMFGTVADWGLTLITVREASKNLAEASGIIGNVLVIRLLLALLAATAAMVAIWFLPYAASIKMLTSLAALSLLAMSLKTSFQIIFNVKLEMQNWAISEIADNLLMLVLLVFLITARASFAQIILAFVTADFFAAGVAAFLGWRLLPLKYGLWHQNTKFLLLESLPMGAILVLFTIYNRIDTVILSLFKGSEAVGLYGAAYRIFEVLVLGAAYFANSVLPLISNLALHDRERLGRVYRKSFVVLLFLGTGVAIANYVFAPLAIAVVGGAKFAGSVVALRILSLSLVVSYFNHLNGYTLIALGRQWWSLAIAVAALTVNVGLNLLLIPVYSYPAAAWVTFITEGMIVVLSLVLIRRELHIVPLPGDVLAVAKELVMKRGQIF